MIKCKANPKKDGVAVKVNGKGIQIAVETLAVVKSVVKDVMPEGNRQALINSIRSLLDDLEANATDEQNADTAEIEEDED